MKFEMIGKSVFCNEVGKVTILDRIEDLEYVKGNVFIITKYLAKRYNSSDIIIIRPLDIMYFDRDDAPLDIHRETFSLNIFIRDLTDEEVEMIRSGTHKLEFENDWVFTKVD